jgi:hypothetical protein
MYLKKVISKKTSKTFFVGILSATYEKAGSASLSQWYGSTDPDPYENVTDPQHCFSGDPILGEDATRL